MRGNAAVTIEVKVAAVCAAIVLLGSLLGWNLLIKKDLAELAIFEKKKSIEPQKQQKTTLIQSHLDKIKTYDSYLSPSTEVSWAVEAITSMANNAGLSVTSMSPMDPENGVYLDKLLLKIEADCGYHELGDFVSRLESYSKFLKISRLSLKRSKTGSELKASMVIAIFVAK